MLNNPYSDLQSLDISLTYHRSGESSRILLKENSQRKCLNPNNKLSKVNNISAYLGNLWTCLKKVTVMEYSNCTDP